jgi:hypothetical protein
LLELGSRRRASGDNGCNETASVSSDTVTMSAVDLFDHCVSAKQAEESGDLRGTLPVVFGVGGFGEEQVSTPRLDLATSITYCCFGRGRFFSRYPVA